MCTSLRSHSSRLWFLQVLLLVGFDFWWKNAENGSIRTERFVQIQDLQMAAWCQNPQENVRRVQTSFTLWPGQTGSGFRPVGVDFQINISSAWTNTISINRIDYLKVWAWEKPDGWAAPREFIANIPDGAVSLSRTHVRFLMATKKFHSFFSCLSQTKPPQLDPNLAWSLTRASLSQRSNQRVRSLWSGFHRCSESRSAYRTKTRWTRFTVHAVSSRCRFLSLKLRHFIFFLNR